VQHFIPCANAFALCQRPQIVEEFFSQRPKVYMTVCGFAREYRFDAGTLPFLLFMYDSRNRRTQLCCRDEEVPLM